MIQVIDIRKHDPKKVIEYWINKGGIDIGCGRSNAYPYVGIGRTGNINGFVGLQEKHCLIDLPTEPQLISGKEYTMRNGGKAVFLNAAPNGMNVFYHVYNETVWKYYGLKFNTRSDSRFDIILEPEKKEPRTIYVNEYHTGIKRSLVWETRQEGLDMGAKLGDYVRTIKFVEVIEN
jgi:hypothetical protein